MNSLVRIHLYSDGSYQFADEQLIKEWNNPAKETWFVHSNMVDELIAEFDKTEQLEATKE